MRIVCSCCGASRSFPYCAAGVLLAVREGWGSCGPALYCPECSATWDERNKGRPMAGEAHTIALMDRLRRQTKGEL